MKLLHLVVFTAIALLVSGAAAEEAHAHDHGHKCACEAKEMGFKIDCKTAAPITAAEKYLADNTAACSVKGNTNAECAKSYLILQSHHDFCPHDQLEALSPTIKNVIHVYEDVYTDCIIPRQFVSTLSQCPAVNCTAMKVEGAAAAKMLYDDCNSACATSTSCKTAFQTVLMGHDVCDEARGRRGQKGRRERERRRTHPTTLRFFWFFFVTSLVFFGFWRFLEGFFFG